MELQVGRRISQISPTEAPTLKKSSTSASALDVLALYERHVQVTVVLYIFRARPDVAQIDKGA